MRCADNHTVSRTILIVDDHARLPRPASARCSRPTATTSSARPPTGARGLSAALALKPDVVLLDVRLPDMDGFAVALSLAENGGGPAVIVTSSSDDPLYPARAARSGRARVRRQARRLRRRAGPHPRR